MIWIELLGPSGVGKSYWYEKFIKKFPEFEPKQMVLNHIYNSDEFSTLPLKIKILFWIYKLNLYRISNHFKHKLFTYFFKGFQRKSKAIFPETDNVFIKKYLESIDSLNEPQIVVLKKIDYFHQKLIEFKFYQFYLQENDVFLAEDGLMHLCPVFLEELKADKVLILEKNYESLVAQRLQRAKKKPTTFIEFLLSEKDLKSYIKDYYQLYDVKIKSIIQNYQTFQIKKIDLDEQHVLNEMYNFIVESKK